MARHFPSAPALLIVLAACAGDPSAGSPIVVSDSSGVRIVQNELLRLEATCSLGASPTLSIGEEEGGEEYLLSRPQGVRRLSDGRIVFAHQSTWQVRWYGPDGRYIRSAARQGEGPGEFTNPYGLQALPGDTVYAGNSRPYQFLVFGPDGEYVRTVRPSPVMGNPARASGILADGRMMLAVDDLSRGFPSDFSVQERVVMLHDADGMFRDTITRMPNGRQGKTMAGNFSTTPFFESYSHAVAGDTIIVLGHGAERELRVLRTGPGTPLALLIRWSGGDRSVTKADLDAERAREKAEYERFGGAQAPEHVRHGYESNVHPNRPVAAVMPAMNAIRMGTDGRLWIREYQPPADTSARRWIAFNRDGRFDCKLSAPNFGVEEFGADYVLVIHRDSLGVERVKQFPLHDPKFQP